MISNKMKYTNIKFIDELFLLQISMIQKDVSNILYKVHFYKSTQYNIYPKQKQNSFTFMFLSILIVLKITFKITKAHTFKEKILKEHKVL